MTRRHFIAIAAAIRQELSETRSTEEDLAIEAVAHRLASLFAEVNDSFDRSRFLAACGIDDARPRAAELARLPIDERTHQEQWADLSNATQVAYEQEQAHRHRRVPLADTSPQYVAGIGI